jgi:hypothetical protein
VALQFEVAVKGFGQDLYGSDEDAKGLRQQGYGGLEFDFYDKIWVAARI